MAGKAKPLEVIQKGLSSQKFLTQLKKALPQGINAEKYARGIMTTIMMDKGGKLKQCTPDSIFRAALTAAQIGLNIDANGHAFLVPYKIGKTNLMQCQLIPGYKGWIFKAYQSKLVKNIYFDVVYRNDVFRVQRGTDPKIEHIPNYEDKSGRTIDNIMAVYSVIEFVSGAKDFEIMTWEDVMQIKDGLKYQSDIWDKHPVQMAFKTVLRRHAKRWQLPQLDDLENLDTVIHQGHIATFDEKGNIQQGDKIEDDTGEDEKPVIIKDPKKDAEYLEIIKNHQKKYNIPDSAITTYMKAIYDTNQWDDLGTNNKKDLMDIILNDNDLIRKYEKKE